MVVPSRRSTSLYVSISLVPLAFPSSLKPFLLDARASKVLIAMTVLMGLFAGLNLLYLRYANKQKAIRRKERYGDVDSKGSWKEEGDRHCDFEYAY